MYVELCRWFANVNSITLLKIAFYHFSGGSWLEANQDKSHLVVVGTDEAITGDLLRIIGFPWDFAL